MKKPKITKGEWILGDENNLGCEVELPNGSIISMDRSGRYTEDYVISREEMLSNRKAISAVPEMIDALIESTKLLEHLKSVETEAELIYEIEQQIEMNKFSALKKAGCNE